MPAPKKAFPAYRHHKTSGRAVVTIDGRDIYLGQYESEASREKYDRVIAEWLTAGRRLPPKRSENTVISVVEVVRDFMRHAKRHYLKHGRETSTVNQFANALKPLVALYGRTPAGEFAPSALKAVREHMIAEATKEGKRLYRKTVNDRCWRIKHLFAWAVSEELVPPEVFQRLRPL
ncbi:MAG: site-specific integrase, partial [Planctomycetes bacterium]|nr:site-specific integrase [Planctomycetota bacterium]